MQAAKRISLKRSLAFLAAASMAASVSACSGDSTAEDGSVVIGVITPLSGPTSELGKESRDGVNLAVNEINASGGIKAMGGADVKVVFGDSEGDPQVAAAAVRRLVSQDGATIVLGADSSAGAAAGAQAAESARTLYLNSTSQDDTLASHGYKYLLDQQVKNASNAQAIGGLLSTLEARGDDVSRVAILNEDSAKGEGDAKALTAVVKEIGLEVVSTTSYSVSSTDLIPTMTRVRASNPDVVAWSGYTEDQARGIEAMRSLKWSPYVVGGGSGISNPDMLKLVGPEQLDELRAASTNYYSSRIPEPRSREFAAAFENAYDREPIAYSIMAYEGMHTLAALLEAAGSTTADDLLNAATSLKIPDEETAMPFAIEFDENGRNAEAQPFITQWQDGKEEIIWPEEIKTADPAPAA